MNPLIASTLAPILSKLDILHLMQVVTGDDQPSPAEVKTLRLLNQLLSTPIGGEVMWDKVVSFSSEKGMDALVLSYIVQGLEKFGVEMVPPESLNAAKPAFTAVVDAILTNPAIPQLKAVSQCPSCQYIYGVTQ